MGRSADGHSRRMFLFFSNTLGCLGSILLSLVVTGVLVLIFTLL